MLSSSAEAGLQQPNGAAIPAPAGCNGGKTTGLGAAFACVCDQPNVCNQGAPCPGGAPMCDLGMNGTCETTTWHNQNDNSCIPSNLSGLDPVADAKIVPETFHPTCPQTYTVLSRGTAKFKNAFGWYNVTPNKPGTADLHLMLDCNAGAGTAVVLDLKSQPAYAGGDIGFFLVTPESHATPGTCDGGDCCATVARVANNQGYVYFSERKYNPDFMGANSWIHLLTYESKIAQSKYYFAWEDSNFSPNNDFTDLLTSVTGIQCSGAGVACDTGKQGVCAAGITVCENGALSCKPVFASGGEQCNGLDDDCNGAIDDNATCPTPGDVCYHGHCVPPCDKGEFPCIGNTVCDPKSNLCVDPTCVGVACKSGEVCHGGQCVAPCTGVVCPHGQSCVADACVDLCKGVSCNQGEVCRQGLCFAGCAACDGVSCDATSKCDAPSGECRDPSCPMGCPVGQFCDMGSCKDDCVGAKCPSGEACMNGNCVVQGGSGGGGVGGGSSTSSSTSTSSSGASTSSGAGGAGGQGDWDVPTSKSSCGCGVVGASGEGSAATLLLALALAARRRNERRRRAAKSS
jgi:MYXO-CTERM domain-containing protein